MQVNQETLQKDKQLWVPDLQLSLSQTNDHNDDDDHKTTDRCRETQEINTRLSLS